MAQEHRGGKQVLCWLPKPMKGTASSPDATKFIHVTLSWWFGY